MANTHKVIHAKHRCQCATRPEIVAGSVFLVYDSYLGCPVLDSLSATKTAATTKRRELLAKHPGYRPADFTVEEYPVCVWLDRDRAEIRARLDVYA